MDWKCSDRSRRVGFEGIDVRKLVLLHDSSSCKVKYDMVYMDQYVEMVANARQC